MAAPARRTSGEFGSFRQRPGRVGWLTDESRRRSRDVQPARPAARGEPGHRRRPRAGRAPAPAGRRRGRGAWRRSSILGETGTGKGLLAGILHRAGPRAAGPFVDVNCAAIPETLLEAELFGFERGAFTDARHAKPGLLQTAHRGMLFLDEVGLLPEGLQAKLLKVLEERSVRRLGSTRSEPVDVWIVAATSEDLQAAMRARRFREDLYHRLAVLTLRLPPLRERGEDIVRLAEHFLGQACADYGLAPRTLAPDARAALLGLPVAGERAGAGQHDGAGGAAHRRGRRSGGGAGAPEPCRRRRGVAARARLTGPERRRRAAGPPGQRGASRAAAPPRGPHRDPLEHRPRRGPARHPPEHAALPHGEARARPPACRPRPPTGPRRHRRSGRAPAPAELPMPAAAAAGARQRALGAPPRHVPAGAARGASGRAGAVGCEPGHGRPSSTRCRASAAGWTS